MTVTVMGVWESKWLTQVGVLRIALIANILRLLNFYFLGDKFQFAYCNVGILDNLIARSGESNDLCL